MMISRYLQWDVANGSQLQQQIITSCNDFLAMQQQLHLNNQAKPVTAKYLLSQLTAVVNSYSYRFGRYDDSAVTLIKQLLPGGFLRDYHWQRLLAHRQTTITMQLLYTISRLDSWLLPLTNKHVVQQTLATMNTQTVNSPFTNQDVMAIMRALRYRRLSGRRHQYQPHHSLQALVTITTGYQLDYQRLKRLVTQLQRLELSHDDIAYLAKYSDDNIVDSEGEYQGAFKQGNAQRFKQIINQGENK